MRRYAYILLMITSCAAKAQYSPIYSQYMFNTLAINPAYAGSRETFCTNASYRTQWTGIDGNPVTQTLSVHTPLKNKSISVGVLMYNDEFGVTKNTGFKGYYSYKLIFKNSNLSFGLSGGIKSLRNNWAEVTTNFADVVFAENSRKYYAPEAGAGVFFYNKKFYAGLGVPELLQTNFINNKIEVSSSPRLFNWFVNSGFLYDLNENIKLKPSVLFKYFNKNFQLDGTLNFIFNDLIGAGISYRNNKELVGLLEVYLNRQLRIGYSYDYNLTPMQNQFSGSHEIMLQYEFGRKENLISPRYF